MSEARYGSYPNGLLKFRRAVGKDEWANVRVLDLAEYNARIWAPMRRFPQRSDGVIDWDLAPSLERREVGDNPQTARVLAELVVRHFPAGQEVLIRWTNSDVPSVALSRDLLVAHVAEVVDSGSDFWLWSGDGTLVIEHDYFNDGCLSVAEVPPAAG